MKPEDQLKAVMAHLKALGVEPITVYSNGTDGPSLRITIRLRNQADLDRVAESGWLGGSGMAFRLVAGEVAA